MELSSGVGLYRLFSIPSEWSSPVGLYNSIMKDERRLHICVLASFGLLSSTGKFQKI